MWKHSRDPPCSLVGYPLACSSNCTYDLHQARKLISLAARSLLLFTVALVVRTHRLFLQQIQRRVLHASVESRPAAPATATCIKHHALIFNTPASSQTRRPTHPQTEPCAGHRDAELQEHREQLLGWCLQTRWTSNHRPRPSQASPQTPNPTRPTVVATGDAVLFHRSPPTSV